MVGLDVGSKTIKAVELDKEGDNFRLQASGIIGHTGEAVEHIKDEKDMISLAEIIKKLFREAKISSKQVAVYVPESQVFTRTITFPMLTDQEIESAVKWEAEQYIPIPVKEAIIQHEILERREDASAPGVAVLLVAAPRTLVEKYTRLTQMAGLTPIAVETSLMAAARALAPVNQTVMVIDLGARSTDMAIVKNGMLSFSRSVATAGEAFTRAVAQTLGVEMQQAEAYKRTYGLSGSQLEGKIKGALDPVFRMVTDEIKKAIHFYQTEEKGDTPKAVILSGGTAGMPEAVGALSEMLGLEVVVGNPFAKVVVNPDAAKSLAPFAPLYSIAVGLAERGE
jgi:type IV pilus assembly protein PilM